MLRRAWSALLAALASVLARWADGAHVRLLALRDDDVRELRRQLKDEQAENARLNADVEFSVKWRAREIASMEAETAAHAAKKVLVTARQDEE